MKPNKPLNITDKYIYEERLRIWDKFATKNAVVTKCEKCKKTHAHKSVLIETGEHICWYCWITKGEEYGKVVAKPVVVKAPKVVVKKEPRPINSVVKSKPILKHTAKPTEAKNTTYENTVTSSVFKDVTAMPHTSETVVVVNTSSTTPTPIAKLEKPTSFMEATKMVGADEKYTEKLTNTSKLPVFEEKRSEYDETKASNIFKDVTGKISESDEPTSKTKKLSTKNVAKCKHTCGYICHGTCGHNKNCEICHSKSQIVEHSATQIESKYRRLKDQPQSEKFSLTRAKRKLSRGKCSFDPKADYAIEMLNIYKSFLNGKVIANDGIDLRVKRNEVHAIIGENGAGKSTLMSILFGIYSPDSGTIKVNGEQVFFSSAKDASKVGLGMVHQHFQLVPTNTVLQNVILGSEIATLKLGFLQNKEAREKITAIIDKYKLNLDIDEKISKLTVGQQQKTEILKLLYRNANILIFDEPTAVLSPDEIEQFLKMIKDLKNEGKTIIIITHKFNEIKSIADRATVIRLGTFISDFDIKDKTIEQMAAEMIGREVVDIKNSNHKFAADVVLEIKDLKIHLTRNTEKDVPPMNFKIHAGEIFAIAGVEGNGQSELVQAISGLSHKYEGKIILSGKNISNYSIEKRNEAGLSHIPENRHKHGLILDLPIYMNAVANEIDKQPFSKYGFLNETQIREYTRNLIKKFDIRGSTRGTSMARGLSGGNQQKLILARELSHDNKLIIMMQPTRGLDLGAVTYIHEKILEEKAKGHAILLISYELDEIISLADTIAVMSDGELLEASDTKRMTRSHIGQLMAGKE